MPDPNLCELPDGVSKEDYLDAIRSGVRDAFMNAFQDSWEKDQLSLHDAIGEAVRDAFPFGSDIEKAVKEGVQNCFPYESQILMTIGEATENAMSTH